MKRILHPFLGALLSLLLAVTGLGMATARGSAGAPGQITVCTGTGPVMISLDAAGHPNDIPRYCPERALALLAAVAMAQPPVIRPFRVMRAVAVTLILPEVPMLPRTTSSRDPPRPV